MTRNRNIRVRAVRRSEPDIRRLGRALIELAEAQAEADAQAEHQRSQIKTTVIKKPSAEPSKPEVRS